jgi:hypothetical protein
MAGDGRLEQVTIRDAACFQVQKNLAGLVGKPVVTQGEVKARG